MNTEPVPARRNIGIAVLVVAAGCVGAFLLLYWLLPGIPITLLLVAIGFGAGVVLQVLGVFGGPSIGAVRAAKKKRDPKRHRYGRDAHTTGAPATGDKR